ncbi:MULTISPECIES: TonB-dependent receptor [unclassified Pseudoalteromonas]|uniref:TonB-dependent receptor domain-containing protein n=1 Tax=unclassified Pseudoalteromonas TaxID=194690 RepID=UPI000C070E5F|nr:MULTISPECIES: TonB-dependent receptor [unclassified Pseudoalteromonas]MDB2356102.1 TonB-dependent receptor [Pseudoalteromonas sp.]MDP2633810.1 TonB-dependent receptor [Pseudoalteromonas sp. 1_MG-2023]PHN88970.1 TonB-dependent receptor [Pseudoalteromonas sp. 3D05]TGE85511.1 TonB-dependent receptor [Pseudoalteromonas sp. KS88]
MSYLVKPSLIALAVAANFSVHADEKIPEKNMERMVVTATGFEQKVTEAPASISIITNEDIKSHAFTSVLDAVQYLEGIDVGTTRDKTGQGSVSMRGLTGEYTLLLINGKRQNNHGDIYPNNFGGNAFNHVPPADAIERVEVIRGPASTLYGADALGGVINIITKKHTADWGGAVSFSRSLQQDDSFGDDITTDINVSGPLIENVLSLGFRGSVYEQQASSPTFEAATDPNGVVHARSLGFGRGGRTVDNTNEQFGFTINYSPFEDHHLSFDYDNSSQVYDNSPSYDLESGSITYPLGTKDNIESIWASRRGKVNPRAGYAADQKFDRQWWSLSYDGELEWATVKASVSYVDTQNNGRTLPLSVAERLQLQQMYDGTGEYADMDEQARKDLAEETFLPRPVRPLESSQYTYDLRFDIPMSGALGDHNFVVGGQLIDGELKDGVFGLESNEAGKVQEQNMYSIFAEDNWMMTDNFTLTAGARFDNHDVFGSQVSPRLYGVYNVNNTWTVKGGISTGYKTPKTTDLYDGITGFGGQGTSPFAGNPELEPETSVNSEVALYWNSLGGEHNFNITYYNTKFEDKIARGDTVFSCEQTNDVRPCVNLGQYDQLGYQSYSQKINIDEVDLQGIEIAGQYTLTETISLNGNYTWTDSEQQSGSQKGQPLTNSAEHMANITLNWEATDFMEIYLQGVYRSDRYRGWDNVHDQALYYKNYNLFNLGAQFYVNEYIQINARVNNLLDEDFTSYSTTYTDLNGDGEYEYLTGRGVISEVSFTDDYNVKDKGRNFWVGVTAYF